MKSQEEPGHAEGDFQMAWEHRGFPPEELDKVAVEGLGLAGQA